jgi:hypothetical protein
VTGPRRFDPSDLGPGGGRESDEALSAGAWLDAAMLDVPVQPSRDFGDRVMAALATEPTPAPAGFLAPLRRRGYVAGFAASVRQAWASAFTGGRPAMVRASALAYVLAVAIAGTALAGAATIGVGSALGILGPSPTQSPAPVTPAPTNLAEPSGLQAPETNGPEASEEPGESDAPGATDDHGGNSGPGSSDDHSGGDSSGPGSSDGSDDHSGPSGTSGSDDSGSGSGSGSSETSTPRPSDTPRPTGTPKPTSTSGSGGDS